MRIQRLWKQPAYRWPILFFAAFLLLGSLIFGDYGISWDEDLQRQHGFVSAQYINEVFPYADKEFTWYELKGYQYRFHGVWFTLPLVWLEEALGLDTPRQVYRMRHAATFFMFWLGVIGFYQILRRRYGHWGWALLGSALLFLSPRVFGHAFFNPKDIPFLALFIWSSWSLYRFWLQPTARNALVHALFCGMLISMRIIGVLMPVMTLFLLLADPILGKRESLPALKDRLQSTLVYLPFTAGFTVLFWPYLWRAPYNQFVAAFAEMSKYSWGGKVLFEGRLLFGTELPWYYIPKWIGLTVPLLYLLLFAFGLGVLLWLLIKNVKTGFFGLWANEKQRMDWASLGLITAPILAIIVLESVVYDGWRHLYFVYPSLLYVAVLGGYKVWEWSSRQTRSWYRYALAGILALNTLYLGQWMIRNHPYQQVYFNALAPEPLLGQYDLDYWGTSYRIALQELAAMDTSDTIKVAFGSAYPGEQNIAYLHPLLQKRFQQVETIEEADYYITNYRYWEERLREAIAREGVYGNEEVYVLRVGGAKVLGVYRL